MASMAQLSPKKMPAKEVVKRIVTLKPRTPRDLKAFTGAIVRHLERQADGPISNAYPYSDESDYQAWKGRRHTAMFTALRVLNRLAR
jgi:hypothetical protein